MEPSREPTPKPQRVEGPSITFIEPTPGGSLPAGVVQLAVEVEQFDVVAKQFEPPVDGEGHVHFYLDVEELPTTHARPATGEYRSVSRTEYTWTGVPAGEHTFSVQLVGNDHVPLNPPAKDRVRITVR